MIEQREAHRRVVQRGRQAREIACGRMTKCCTPEDERRLCRRHPRVTDVGSHEVLRDAQLDGCRCIDDGGSSRSGRSSRSSMEELEFDGWSLVGLRSADPACRCGGSEASAGRTRWPRALERWPLPTVASNRAWIGARSGTDAVCTTAEPHDGVATSSTSVLVPIA
jgi:hypothetical protein